MKTNYTINRLLTALILWMGVVIYSSAQVSFTASAPRTVEVGQQFQVRYAVNAKAKDLRAPDFKGFEVLFGPATSQSYSTSIINGKRSSETNITYTYTLQATKEGAFSLSPATISVDGASYKSNAVTIKVLPSDGKGGGAGNSSSNADDRRPTADNGQVTANNAFIRAIISKNNVYEQEGFTVTFRLYTTYNVVDFGRIEFPEFEGFMVEEVDMPANQQLQMERYNGKNYFTADLKKSLLFPQRSGKITIPSGNIEMVFSVPSGRKVSTFFGAQEVDVDVSKNMRTNPVTIDVKPLPDGKPASFKNAVGTFTMKPSISTQQTRANEPITLNVEISGTGNLKLFGNPDVKLHESFEPYDPTMDNSYNVTTNGLTGIRKIEYLAIPRYEGEYTIPAVEFSYFDLNTHSYKTLSSPSYTIKVAPGDPSKSNGQGYMSQQDVKVEQDIRFIKTNAPTYHTRNRFFFGSALFWLILLLPIAVLVVLYLINRKRIKENANMTLVRVKRANKVAIKRLKTADKYRKNNQKEQFFEEILRALWGYFSDKLSIPVANLSKTNIEAELSKKGIDEQLTSDFMNILNTCEFARYAPVDSGVSMDTVYDNTVVAIGAMEDKLK